MIISFFIISAEKEKRATEQSQRELRMKLLNQIEGIDENLNLVKENIKHKMEEMKSKINNVENKNVDHIAELKNIIQGLEMKLTEKINENFKQLQGRQDTELCRMNARQETVFAQLTENMKECASKINGLSERNLTSLAELKFSTQSQETRLTEKIDDNIKQLMEIQESVLTRMEQNVSRQVTDVSVFKNDAADLIEKVTEVSDKIMDFEKNKRNNLIFCGIPNDANESPSSLDSEVRKAETKLNYHFSPDQRGSEEFAADPEADDVQTRGSCPDRPGGGRQSAGDGHLP